eukprot:UN10154
MLRLYESFSLKVILDYHELMQMKLTLVGLGSSEMHYIVLIHCYHGLIYYLIVVTQINAHRMNGQIDYSVDFR